MFFARFTTIEIDQGGAVTVQWLQHDRHGYHTVIVIDDGQVHPVVRPGAVSDRRFARATSAGVEAVGAAYSESEARDLYRRVTEPVEHAAAR